MNDRRVAGGRAQSVGVMTTLLWRRCTVVPHAQARSWQQHLAVCFAISAYTEMICAGSSRAKIHRNRFLRLTNLAGTCGLS